LVKKPKKLALGPWLATMTMILSLQRMKSYDLKPTEDEDDDFKPIEDGKL
jgi:hypothetical protein